MSKPFTGWMKKKGEQRYFSLEVGIGGAVLSYSTSPENLAKSKQTTRLDLRGAQVSFVGLPPFTLRLDGPLLNLLKKGKPYILTANSFEESVEWAAVLAATLGHPPPQPVQIVTVTPPSIAIHLSAIPRRGSVSPQATPLTSGTFSVRRNSVVTPKDTAALNALSMGGWLVKHQPRGTSIVGRAMEGTARSDKRRWFALKGCELTYMESEGSEAVGTLDLRGSTVSCEGANSLTFTLVGPNLNGSKRGKSYTLTAETFEDMRAWTAILGKVATLTEGEAPVSPRVPLGGTLKGMSPFASLSASISEIFETSSEDLSDTFRSMKAKSKDK